MQNSRLDAQIVAINTAHVCANQIMSIARAYFEPYVGSSIYDEEDALYSAMCTKFNYQGISLQHYISFPTSTLCWHIKTSEPYKADSGEIITTRYTKRVFFGRVKDGVLLELFNNIRLKDDYTRDGVIQMFAERERLEKQFKSFVDDFPDIWKE